MTDYKVTLVDGPVTFTPTSGIAHPPTLTVEDEAILDDMLEKWREAGRFRKKKPIVKSEFYPPSKRQKE